MKVLEVSVFDRVYCFPLRDVREVVPRFEISEVPLAPSYIKGLINLRGKIISVVDLGRRLQSKDIKIVPQKTCIVIISIDDIEVGVLVEEVNSVRSIDDENISENIPMKNGETTYITGVIRNNENDQLNFLIDLAKVLEIDLIRRLIEQKSG